MGVDQPGLRPSIPLVELPRALTFSSPGACVYTHQRRARVPNRITQPLEVIFEIGFLFSVAFGPHLETHRSRGSIEARYNTFQPLVFRAP